jgi:hypothetical protein
MPPLGTPATPRKFGRAATSPPPSPEPEPGLPTLSRWQHVSYKKFLEKLAKLPDDEPVIVEDVPPTLLEAIYFLARAEGMGAEPWEINPQVVPVIGFGNELVKVHPAYESDKHRRQDAACVLRNILFDIVSSFHFTISPILILYRLGSRRDSVIRWSFFALVRLKFPQANSSTPTTSTTTSSGGINRVN